jgi:TonB family protein
MHCRRFPILVFAFLMAARLASAQEVLSIDKLTLIQHADHPVYPVYPPIAKAARIDGTVDIAVQIGVTGKIESMKIVRGPAMLQQSARDCLEQWNYRPFVKDGKPVVVTGTVSFVFNATTGMASPEFILAGDRPTRGEEKIAKRFSPLLGECKKDISARPDDPAATSVCKQAAETAEEFAPDGHFIEKREAFVSAAWAFLDSGDLKTALTYAVKAIDIVKLGHDDDSGSNAAYCVRGIVEGKLGELEAADQDMVLAEDFERKKIVWAEQVGLELSDSYRRDLGRDLRFHAKVLKGLSRPDEAQKKLDEAAKYN